MEDNMTEEVKKDDNSPSNGEGMGDEKKATAKKIKNLISIIILLAGLFLGSLFVDIGQVIKGSGYSAKNLDRSQIFEANGKTWVAYDDPAVPITIINDDKCAKCDVSSAVVWLKSILPTISTQKVSFDSTQGKALIDKYGIKSLPAFIFDASIEKTQVFSQASSVLDKKDSSYILNTQAIGMPVGKFLTLPTINDSDPTMGNKDAAVKVVIYSDYQCPYCKVLYQSLRDTMKQYGDRVLFDWKHLPLDIHPQANSAALASECAQEQNKFWEYSDLLYQNQTTWGATKDTNLFKSYAQKLGLNTAQFNQCMDSKKYQSQIDADKAEADGFGLTGTPAIFINDQFETGAISADQLKTDIDAALNPGQQPPASAPSNGQPSTDQSQQAPLPADNSQATPPVQQ